MLRSRVPGLRPTAALLATALAGLPAYAMANEPPVVEDDSLTAAQELYGQGEAKFETADYGAAVQLWTEAYASVPDTAEGAQIKVLLIYNIATARQKAFEVSQDPAELRQAKILLGNFEQSIASLYGEGDEADAERSRVRARIAALDEQLATIESEAAADPTPTEPTEEPQIVDQPPPTPDRDQDPAPSRGLVIGGAVCLSLGAAGVGLMAAGLGIGSGANDISALDPDDVDSRRSQFDRGRMGNALAIAGGVSAGVLVVTGAVLLGMGISKRRRVALTPTLGPHGPAMVVRGRF